MRVRTFGGPMDGTERGFAMTEPEDFSQARNDNGWARSGRRAGTGALPIALEDRGAALEDVRIGGDDRQFPVVVQ